MEMIRNQWDNVRHFGLQYELENIMVNIGVKKRLSVQAILKRQKCYEKMSTAELEQELKNWYRKVYEKELDLDYPVTYNEKIQWIKSRGATEEITRLVDKYLVRDWIKEKIGEEYLIPLLGVWDSWDQIDFAALPNKFVLKCNHGSGMNLLVEDKSKINLPEEKRKFDEWMQYDFAFLYQDFQMQYRGIKRKILAEQFMNMQGWSDLLDYKFHCYNGEPIHCQVISERRRNECIDFYDMQWNHLDFIDVPKGSPIKNSALKIEKPKHFEEMKRIAKILAEGFPYVRVDLYEIDGRVYFGEMTFTPGSGKKFQPDEMDKKLGDMISLNL